MGVDETVALCGERFAFLFDLTANEGSAPAPQQISRDDPVRKPVVGRVRRRGQLRMYPLAMPLQVPGR